MRGGAMAFEERRDQHYLRRPGNIAVRRYRRRRDLIRWTALIAVQLAVLAAVLAGARRITLAVINSSHFDLRTITFEGNARTPTDDLMATARPALGTNIFRLDAERLRADLRRHPWVRDVTVRRSLPATLEIAVTERESAAIASWRGTAWLVDATGRRLDVYGPDLAGADFPVLTGIEALPRAAATRRIREGAAAVAAIGAGFPDLAPRVSEIDLSQPDRLTVRLADGSPLLLLNNDDPLRNLGHYEEARELIDQGAGGAPLEIAHIDLRFRGRIAMAPRTDPQEGPP